MHVVVVVALPPLRGSVWHVILFAPQATPLIRRTLCFLFVQVTLHCWIESGRRDIAKRVGPLFRDMKNRFLSGEVSLRPDMVSYSMTLEAYVRDMQTDAATGLLYEMIDDFLDGNSEAEPTIRTQNGPFSFSRQRRCIKLTAPLRLVPCALQTTFAP